MMENASFMLWAAYTMGGLLFIAELVTLALRYRNIRQHLGWPLR